VILLLTFNATASYVPVYTVFCLHYILNKLHFHMQFYLGMDNFNTIKSCCKIIFQQLTRNWQTISSARNNRPFLSIFGQSKSILIGHISFHFQQDSSVIASHSGLDDTLNNASRLSQLHTTANNT